VADLSFDKHCQTCRKSCSGFVVDHWTLSQLTHCFMLLLYWGWITATQFCFCTEESHIQVAVCYECWRTSDQWDSEVWTWSVTANAWWPALGDCSSEAAVPARRNSPSLSSASGSKISHQVLWLKFPVASIYDLSGVVNCLCHLFTAACLEAVLFSLAGTSLEVTARWFAISSCDSKHFWCDLKTHLFTRHYGVLVC